MKAIADAPARPAAAPEEITSVSQSRVLLHERSESHMVKVRDFSTLTEEEGGTRIFFGNRSVLVRHSLAEMEEGLDKEHFFRVNSTTIVNLDVVTHYTTSPRGFFVAALPDGTSAEFTAERSRLFQERFAL
jgi:DNA-binding LytR/AlgR family response regulator